MTQPKRVMLVSGIISAILGLLAGYLGGRLAGAPVTQALAPAPAVMRAEHFQLVDQEGRQRGRLEIDAQGVARLALFGRDAAAPLVSLAADPQGGAHLELGDAQHQRAVEINTDLQGSRQIALYHEGQLRLGLEVQKNGVPAVNLYDQGSRLISLGLTNRGDPHLIFAGEGQKTALELIGRKNGDRSLTIHEKNGTPRLVLGLKDDKKAALGLFDRKGKTRVALMDEPSLILLKAGQVVRTLP
jgi:hypothetical protein